ncbi:hypothetical protein L9F63_001242, partial [Diploptera punctata]
ATDVYNEETNSYVDVGITHLTEMIGVAAYSCEDCSDSYPGNVMIIVNRNKFERYATLVQSEIFIESQLLNDLPDILITE